MGEAEATKIDETWKTIDSFPSNEKAVYARLCFILDALSDIPPTWIILDEDM